MRCPQCNSKNIDYGCPYGSPEEYYWCEECKFTGKSWDFEEGIIYDDEYYLGKDPRKQVATKKQVLKKVDTCNKK